MECTRINGGCFLKMNWLLALYGSDSALMELRPHRRYDVGITNTRVGTPHAIARESSHVENTHSHGSQDGAVVAVVGNLPGDSGMFRVAFFACSDHADSGRPGRLAHGGSRSQRCFPSGGRGAGRQRR